MSLMVLETRQLLAAGPLGIDTGSTLSYVDLMKETQPWISLSSTALKTDGNGWPLADARIIALDQRVNQPFNGPDLAAAQPDIGGTYHLSFQGSASLDPDYLNNFTVANQIYSSVTNTTTADLIVPHNTIALLIINFRNTSNPASSTGAGVANVQLIQPGYAANTSQIFTNAEVNALAPFSTVRYLNSDGANNYSLSFNNAYQSYTTSPFQVAAGSHTITFQGLNATGDATAFLDNISITSGTAGQINGGNGSGSGPVVGDAGFEANQIGGGAFLYNPTGGSWTFATSAGITSNGSAFTNLNPNAPQGTQVAFLQNQGTISQTVNNFSAGLYQINFSSMLRDGNPTQQTFQVLVDGKLVGTFAPPVGLVNTLDWSQRKLPSASSQVSGPGAPGNAWEYLVALANASNTDMWINIPVSASDSYIAQLANLIRNGDTINGVAYAGLNPNLKINLEFSNEVWGGILNSFIANFWQAQQAVALGTSKAGNDGITDAYTMAQRYYLERSMQMTNIFRNAFGSTSSNAKIRTMLGAQEGNPGYFASLLPWFEKNYGAPSQYFYGIGGANYENTTDYTSVDSVINGFASNLAQQYAITQQFTTIATYYGLQNIAYEGGPGTAGASTAAGDQISLAASRDPRMQAAVSQLYTTWYAAGGGLAAIYDGPFDVVTPSNQAALVEMSQMNMPTLSAKYRGVLDLANAAPTPVTAGNSVTMTGVTTLPIASDSLGQSFTSPVTGQTNYWLLNVGTAGNYNLYLRAATGSPAGQVTVSTGDSSILGNFTIGSAGSSYVTTLSLHAGLNTLALTTNNPFTVNSLTLSAPVLPALNDAGFEGVNVPATRSAYVYNPTGGPWTFSGSAGVSGNAGDFTSGNTAAPQGTQVAFLQNQGTISQTATFYAPGNYTLSFSAANRSNFGGQQTFKVLVDGAVVGTFVPTKPYTTYTTSSFVLGAGSHTIAFQGLNSTGDATAFLDNVNLTQVASTPLFADSGFESLYLPAGLKAYTYNPTGSAWTFTGTAGVSGNNTDFTNGNPVAPEGQQVGFLQNTGSISQLLANIPAGSYAIAFDLAQRGNLGKSQTVQVLVDGVLISSFTPTSASYRRVSTVSFALAAGSHTVTIRGTNTSGDATAFLDDFAITPQSS